MNNPLFAIWFAFVYSSGSFSSYWSSLFSWLKMEGAPPTSGGGLDPLILAALIGLGGVVLGVLTTSIITLYQGRRNAQLEQKRHEERIKHEQDLLRLQKEFEKQIQQNEANRQREEKEVEAASIAMLRARTQDERIAAYRQSLLADPRIAQLQILDMIRPLDVINTYVRLRLHQETQPSYRLVSDEMDTNKKSDPNALLELSEKRLERRTPEAITPEEAIVLYKRCVIVGDPGAGKSTLLKYLTLRAAQKQLAHLPDLPIHIELQAFATAGHRDLLDFAATLWDERYRFPKAEALVYLHDMLQSGRALLFLDALDETVGGTTKDQAEESYWQVSKAIMDIATRYPLLPIIVTARKAGYHQRPRLIGFTELEVLYFNTEDTKQFIRQWFAGHLDPHKRENAEDLIICLERNLRIQTLAANPLLLSLIVIVYENQLDLPERRAELYKQCVDTLLIKWDASRNIRRLRLFKPEHKQQLLEEIAWHFHVQGQRYFSVTELLEVIAAFLPAIELSAEQNSQVLDEISAENGLLKEQAQDWYGFLHLTLQEYFAAQYVVDHQEVEQLLLKRNDPWWKEIVLLYAGRTPDASHLLRMLLGQSENGLSLREDLFSTDLLLAGRCVAARPTVREVFWREEVISRLFQLLKTTRYSLAANHLASVLAEIGGAKIHSQLIHFLSEEEIQANVRSNTADAMGEVGDCAVVPELVSLLSEEKMHVEVRSSIANAISKLGDRAVVPELVPLLSEEKIPVEVRSSIADAISTLGDRSIAADLVHLVSDKKMSADVRERIVECLGKLKASSVALDFMHLLAKENLDEDVAMDLKNAGNSYGITTKMPMGTGVAYTIGMLGERSIVPDLIHLLSNKHFHANVRAGILVALGRLGEHWVISELVSLLSDKKVNLNFRWLIAIEIGDLRELSVIPDLLRLLTDDTLETKIRSNIADALHRLGDHSIVPELKALLSNKKLDTFVYASIVVALGKLGEPSAATDLVNLLSDVTVDIGIKGSLPFALGKLCGSSGVSLLLNLLSDNRLDKMMRKNIIRAIEVHGANKETVYALWQYLKEPDIADAVYRALWNVSQRARLKVFANPLYDGNEIEVIDASYLTC